MNKKMDLKLDKMLNDLEDFKKSTSTTHIYEDDDKVTIGVSVESLDTIYQPYSGKNMLNEELINFIESTFKMISDKKKDITIKFHYNCEVTDEEKLHIKSLINMHYASEYKETRKQIRNTNIKAWILLSIGAIIMAIYGTLCALEKNFVLRETIGIFSWVFLWESCNLFFFTNSENKLYIIKCFKLFEAKKD